MQVLVNFKKSGINVAIGQFSNCLPHTLIDKNYPAKLSHRPGFFLFFKRILLIHCLIYYFLCMKCFITLYIYIFGTEMVERNFYPKIIAVKVQA